MMAFSSVVTVPSAATHEASTFPPSVPKRVVTKDTFLGVNVSPFLTMNMKSMALLSLALPSFDTAGWKRVSDMEEPVTVRPSPCVK